MIKHGLKGLSWFCFLAGLWLTAMEAIQRHPGFEGRLLIALLIAGQSLAAALVPGRKILLPGAGAMLTIGASAIRNTLTASHFEGYALVVGIACVLQAALTAATAVSPHHPPADQIRRT